MIFKNIFDYILALILLIFLVGLIVLLIIICSFDTKQFGIFEQNRVGKNAKLFKIYKLRTMKGVSKSNITTLKDHNITPLGKFLRKYKLDELPQLFNIIKGEMSFVGPRPDVFGYADKLIGEDRIILNVKPGITGPAQIKYKNEEQLLAEVEDPILYNDKVLWKDKVLINVQYVKEWTFKKDIIYLLHTVFK
ncbi:Sugar transferase involved in LPS biosynthesis (colanic, teichoic acid) [Chishuiella changwenlii]|uniref:Glycosyl transferase n=1 Tax=Chishuiella changwenlii TaxID=1434701 RepID=A0A1M6U1I1_9FLAO|nr:sugar transferase [Chishuiella changwenlii]GGF08712.1 glycosyl transferase [Chishuiella changwenlii]SHK63152.1 Sugar transferase involved in LPS biosynthesis (colanic, teichoic acid) [Chishuiella changwenlii]